MRQALRFAPALLLVSGLALLAGCAAEPTSAVATYDFGLSSARDGDPPDAGERLADVEVTAPAWLNSSGIVYRLAYQDASRVHLYNHSRWVTAPAQLIRERARERLAAAGSARSALYTSALRGAATEKRIETRPYAVRLELLEFSQVFRTPDSSAAVVSVHASLVERSRAVVLTERAFSVEREAASANAQGAVGALEEASAAMLAEVFAWAEVQAADGKDTAGDAAGPGASLRLAAARAKIPCSAGAVGDESSSPACNRNGERP